MVADMQLEVHDKVRMVKSKDANGDTIVHVYVTKHNAGLTTPNAQRTAPVPVVDTAQGANTSAAHAAAGAQAPPSGAAPAGKKRSFRSMEESERRQMQTPAQRQRRQVEEPAPANANPAAVPAATPATTSTIPATGAGPSKPTLGVIDHKRVMNDLKLHGVSETVSDAFEDIFLSVSKEEREYMFERIISSDGDAAKVQRRVQGWVNMYNEENGI